MSKIIELTDQNFDKENLKIQFQERKARDQRDIVNALNVGIKLGMKRELRALN